MDTALRLQTAVVFPLLVAVPVLYYFLIYPFCFSPLRTIPRAHWSVPIPYLGSLWILLRRYQSTNNATTYEAHRRHGPVVRLADNEISVNCYDGGIRTVYSGGWEKHEWYPRQFTNFGVMNMFSTVGHLAHSQKKRTLANVYSKSYLQSSKQVQHNSKRLLGNRVLPLLHKLAAKAEDVNVHELNAAFTMDFMSSFQFGVAGSTNFIENVEERRKFLRTYHSRRDLQFIASEIPPWVRRCLRTLNISLFPAWIHEASAWLEDWFRNLCDKADVYLQDQADSAAGIDDHVAPVVFKQYKTALLKLREKDPQAGFEIHPHLDEGMNFSGIAPQNEQRMTLEIYSEMVDQLAAGHETSSIALTYLQYEMSKNPDMMERLHGEVSGLLPSLQHVSKTALTEIPDPRAVDALPYLNAVVLEILRLHAPIPGMQPRISPFKPAGSTLGPPGHEYTNIPGGVRVSAMAYTLHRIEDVFPDPEKFSPDRWLTASSEQLKEMHRHFWAFGSGGRMCIGSHFATQNIKLLVSIIYANFKTEIVNDEGIEEADMYTTAPKSGKLILRFIKR